MTRTTVRPYHSEGPAPDPSTPSRAPPAVDLADPLVQIPELDPLPQIHEVDPLHPDPSSSSSNNADPSTELRLPRHSPSGQAPSASGRRGRATRAPCRPRTPTSCGRHSPAVPTRRPLATRTRPGRLVGPVGTAAARARLDRRQHEGRRQVLGVTSSGRPGMQRPKVRVVAQAHGATARTWTMALGRTRRRVTCRRVERVGRVTRVRLDRARVRRHSSISSSNSSSVLGTTAAPLVPCRHVRHRLSTRSTRNSSVSSSNTRNSSVRGIPRRATPTRPASGCRAVPEAAAWTPVAAHPSVSRPVVAAAVQVRT